MAKAVKAVGKTSKGISHVAKSNQGNLGNIVNDSLDVVKNNIQAPRPRPEKQTTNLFDELPFA